MNVTDADDRPITGVSFPLAENATSAPLVGHVPCVAGMHLTADVEGGCQVLARREGSSGPFVDIAAAPISLTQYAGQTIPFEFKVVAGSTSAPVERVELRVRVTYEP